MSQVLSKLFKMLNKDSRRKKRKRKKLATKMRNPQIPDRSKFEGNGRAAARIKMF